MSEWKECKLNDIAIINPTEKLSKGIPAKKVAMDIIQPFTKRVPNYLIEPYNGGMKFKNGDTIIARITPCLENGKTAYIDVLNDDEVGFGSTEYIVLREKEGFSDKQFLYYFSISSEFRDVAILSMTGSSGRQRVQTDVVKNHTFLLPPLPEQKAIAAMLSGLDDKIALLHRQNKTLESMAEALFRQWFVEEAAINTIKLGDIIEIFDNKRIPVSSTKRDLMKDGVLYPYYGAATIMDYVNSYIFDGEYLLLGEDGTVQTEEGYPILQLATGKFWANNHTHVLRAKNPFNNFLLYTILKKTSISHIVTGAVQPKINQENLKYLEIEIANSEIIDKTAKLVDGFWMKIQQNNTQIRTLEKMRDSLLPKLMSGEVRVTI